MADLIIVLPERQHYGYGKGGAPISSSIKSNILTLLLWSTEYCYWGKAFDW